MSVSDMLNPVKMYQNAKTGYTNLKAATFNKDPIAMSKIKTNAMNSFVMCNAPKVASLLGYNELANGRVAGNAAMVTSGIVILVTLLVGALILINVKSTAVTAAGNDTEALEMINQLWNTGTVGLTLFALTVLVLAAVVILGYLQSVNKQ
ncbi:hypothetical protein J3E07_001659 [Methanococcus voltae]|uniref:Uncharacterized protein n=1 Tax=Methanococcus voltae TaxID=2188 RepID=A0A8J7S6B4_METVO|nr:hypothetical protein [Methanococcus voltae]MBP2202218.1 hypothetical protein [Methanococcus voltae]